MKKIVFFLLAAMPFFSCNWSDYEIPKSVGVKTSAKYEFSLGTFSGNLSEYLSVQTLTESLGDSDSNVDFKIYDYYPAHSDLDALKMQQFLIDFPIKTVTLDINDYLKDMDFSMALEKMSFAPDVIDLKDFKIKDIEPISVKPDINKKIEKSTNRMECNITIPKTGGESGFSKDVLDSMTANINITSPTFTTMQFYEAKIEFTATPENYDDEHGFSTNLTLGLFRDDEKEPISTIKNVDLTTERTFSFLLNGKTITKNMEIKVISGNAYSSYYGNGSTFVKYNLVSELKNVKIQKVTDLTIEDRFSVPIGGDTGTHITIDIGHSPKCEIGEGSIDIIAKKNATQKEWKGVEITPKITLEGEITAAPEDFKKDDSEGGDEYFIYRTKPLNGVTYHNGEKIIVKGAVDVKIQNANIQFAEDEDDTIIVEPTCNIEEISKLWLELADDDALDGYNDEQPLGSEITKYITAFGIENPSADYRLFELKVDYINTLPEGNDIDLTVTSNYFKIYDEKRKLKAGATNKTEPIVSPEILDRKEIGDDDKIDFNVNWKIPGRGEDKDYPKCTILENLKMGEKYELKVTVTPVFNWDYVEIRANGITEEGVVSTGLNFNSMFESFGDKLVGSDGTSIIDELKLIRMPLYFYCIMPLKGGFDLQGKIAVGTGEIEDGKAIWYNHTEYPTQNPIPVVGKKEGSVIKNEYGKLDTEDFLPKLEFLEGATSDDEVKMVIKAIGESENDPDLVDIAGLFNLHSGSNIIFEYGMQLGGGANESSIRLSKLELKESENSESAKIQFHARIVVPLEIEIEEDIKLSFTKLLNKDESKDLFNRDKATGNDTIEDIINVLEYAQINAYFPKSPSVIQYFTPDTGVQDTDTNIRVEIDPNVAGIKEPYKLKLGKNEPFKIYGEDFSKMLGKYPFSPDIQFIIPAGCFYIRHNFEYDLKMELGAKFNDEEILIFGDKK